MIKIKKLTLKNFLSVGNQEQVITFDRSGLTLILGENLDQPQGDNSAKNGTGKTCIVNALSYVLFNEAVSPIRKLGNFVNNINNNRMLVTLDFEKDNKDYRIERGQKPKIFRWYEGGKLKASDDSEDVVEGDQQGESKDTQKAINNVLHLEAEMFKQILVHNTYAEPFLFLKPIAQRELIEQILGIRVLSEKGDQLLEAMRDSKKQIEIEENKLEAIKASNTQIQKSIDDLQVKSQRWDTQHTITLDELTSNIKSFANIDFDSEIRAFDEQDTFDKKHQKYKTEVDLATAETKTVEKELAKLFKEISDLVNFQFDNQQIERLTDDLSRYNNELSSIDQAIDSQIEIATRQNKDEHQRLLDRHTILTKRYSDDLIKSLTDIDTKKKELTDAISKATDELNNPDTLNCKSCGQALKDDIHLKEVISVINKRIENLTTQLMQQDKHIVELKSKNAEDIKTLENKLKDDVQSLEDDLKTRISKAKKDGISNKETLMSKVVEVTTQIETAKKNNSEKKKEVEEELSVKTEEYEKLGKTLEEKLSLLEEKEQILSTLGERPATIFPSRDDAYQAKALYDQLSHDLKNEHEKKNPYSEQVKTLTDNLQVIKYETLNEYTRLLEHQKFLRELLTDKKSFIRKQIIDQNLAYLNQRISYYTAKVGLPHQVTFQNDLSVVISHMGAELDVGNLSRGETTRLNLSMSWSFRDIWENLNGPINIQVFDEIVDNGMDPQGLEYIFDVLKEISRSKSVFLITHREELQARASQTLIARKQNRFTTYVEC